MLAGRYHVGCGLVAAAFPLPLGQRRQSRALLPAQTDRALRLALARARQRGPGAAQSASAPAPMPAGQQHCQEAAKYGVGLRGGLPPPMSHAVAPAKTQPDGKNKKGT